MTPLRNIIASLEARDEAEALEAWVASIDDDARTLWRECHRGDWLLWLLAALETEPRPLVRAACECLRLAEVALPSCEASPREVLARAQDWLEGFGDVASCRAAGEAAAGVAATTTDEVVRAAALSAYWLSRLIVLAEQRAEGRLAQPIDVDLDVDLVGATSALAAHDDARAVARGGDEAARLAVVHAASAIALDLARHDRPTEPWRERCLDAARRRCADVVREHASFLALVGAIERGGAGARGEGEASQAGDEAAG